MVSNIILGELMVSSYCFANVMTLASLFHFREPFEGTSTGTFQGWSPCPRLGPFREPLREPFREPFRQPFLHWLAFVG